VTHRVSCPAGLTGACGAALSGPRSFAGLKAPRYEGLRSALALLASMLVAAGCASGPLPPATLDAPGDTCSSCRMAVSPAVVAAQIVAPGEEPRWFDDIGCLASFLNEHEDQPDGAVAYIADHRTRSWVRADGALYTRVPELDTPMGSHLVGHADDRSRQDDPVTARGSAVAAGDVFGGRMPPEGSP
jgi:copper chaperone NosL